MAAWMFTPGHVPPPPGLERCAAEDALVPAGDNGPLTSLLRGGLADSETAFKVAGSAKLIVAEVKQLLNEDCAMVPDVKTLMLWIRACERAKDSELAHDLYAHALRNYGLPGRGWSLEPDVCDSLLGAFCKGGRPELAVNFFDHMCRVGIGPSVNGVCLAISAFVKTGAYANAGKWFRLLRLQGSASNITAYNALISGCAKDGSGLDGALAYFSMMTYDGVEPSTITFNALVDCVRQETDLSSPDAIAILLEKVGERKLDGTVLQQLATKHVSRGSLWHRRMAGKRAHKQGGNATPAISL